MTRCRTHCPMGRRPGTPAANPMLNQRASPVRNPSVNRPRSSMTHSTESRSNRHQRRYQHHRRTGCFHHATVRAAQARRPPRSDRRDARLRSSRRPRLHRRSRSDRRTPAAPSAAVFGCPPRSRARPRAEAGAPGPRGRVLPGARSHWCAHRDRRVWWSIGWRDLQLDLRKIVRYKRFAPQPRRAGPRRVRPRAVSAYPTHHDRGELAAP